MREIFRIFLRLGFLGFGGPIAVMAMMEEETCRKRQWLSAGEFAEHYALFKMMPGPISTQMAVYLGKKRAGRWGGVLAGFLFILPGFLMVLGMSALYFQYGRSGSSGLKLGGRTAGVFSGLQAGAIAVVLISVLELAKPYLAKPFKESRIAWLLAGTAGVIVFRRPAWEPALILMAGILGAVRAAHAGREIRGQARPSQDSGNSQDSVKSKLHSIATFGGLVLGQSRFFDLIWICFKAGAFVFGTGLAIVPILEADTVRHFHWLTHQEFMDGLAMGQITPGPVVLTVTFIGYKAAGLLGAIAATIAIFFPCFMNVLWVLPAVWPRIWKRAGGPAVAHGFASWAIPAVIGAIAASTLHLGILTLTSAGIVAVFAASLWLGWRFRVRAWLLIPLAGLLGAWTGGI